MGMVGEMKEFDEWWKSYRSDSESIDEVFYRDNVAFEDAFKAGMLEAAYIAESFESDEVVTLTTIAEAIREAADNGND